MWTKQPQAEKSPAKFCGDRLRISKVEVRVCPRNFKLHFLELQLQRKLDLPRGRGGRCNDPARGAVVGALENNFIRIAEVRVIQNIERLGAELQIQSLADSHSL